MRVFVLSLALLVTIASGAFAQDGTPERAATNANQIFLPLVSRTVDLAPTNNFPVSSATYLGGAGADTASAVDVAPDGTVVFGGALPGANPGGVTPVSLLSGGNGAVVRLGNNGRSVLSISRIGGSVNDLEINNSGQIVVCGDFGMAVLNATASAVLRNANPGAGRRCTIANDGTVAVLVGGSAVVYNSAGTVVGNWAIGGSAQNDIAIDSANGSVFATGFTQVSGNLQLPFIRAWSYTGTLKWKSYDWTSAPSLGADTRGEVIAMGRDGKLYMAGTINGGTGVSVFSRDPKNINVVLGSDRQITTDNYNTPTNVGSVSMSWYGRFNPADGTLEKGQSLLTRLSSGKGNSIVAEAITADEAGNVYIAGGTACCIQNRNARQVAGITVGPYTSGEGFFLAVSADFRKRIIWTPFSAPSSSSVSPATGVGARNGVVAVTLNLTQGALITTNALQANPSTLPEAYVAVWRP